MSIGHRIFVVEEDAVFPISQKTFNELYSGKVGAFPKFAGQTVQIAVVVYTVHQRKPETIIQIDWGCKPESQKILSTVNTTFFTAKMESD